MLTLRSLGGSCVTSRPPIRMRPAVATSSPAISRNVVVLPQPEGPRSVASVPVSTANEMPLTAVVAP
jgi:hypothetical protein